MAVGVTSERLARMVATFTTAGMLMDFMLSEIKLDMGSAFVSLFPNRDSQSFLNLLFPLKLLLSRGLFYFQ